MSGMRTVGGVQRAIGCLVGAAVGDALGAPFEFGPAGQWAKRFPEPVLGGIGEMVGGGGFAWAPGQFTDDTEMAVIVAESLLACGGFDADDQLARFRAWGVHANDVGNLTREVLGCRLPAAEAATQVLASRRGRHTAGNGSIMRVASGALHFAPAGREATVAAALDLSAVTHADPLCQWSVAVAHEMIRLALDGDDPFEGVDAVVALMPAEVRAVLEPLLAEPWSPSAGGPSNGSAMGALAQAVWALRTNDSFAGAVTAVIDLGDDTDSVAAVTGALAGARWGIQQISSRWQTYVHGVVTGADGQTRTYDHTHLHAMARALIGWPQPFDGGDEPVLAPAEVVPGVWASNRSGAALVDGEFAVVSLCRIEPSARRPVRREVYLVDKPGEANASLEAVLDDVLDTIDAFLAEGRQVLVHCHGGRSRTGLVLAGHLMRQGHSLDEAMALLAERWPHAHLRNESFAAELDLRSIASQESDEPFRAALRALTDDHRAAIRATLDRLDGADDVAVANPVLETVQPNGLTVFTYQGVSYSDDASELMDLLYSAGLVVPFDWSTWMSERGNALLESDESIEAVDAVRMITAVTRAERFVEGTFGEQIRNGTLHRMLSVILGASHGAAEEGTQP